MLKRDRLHLILHDFIEFSEKISTRKPFYCMKSVDFKARTGEGGFEVESGLENGKRTIKKIKATVKPILISDLTRKQFLNVKDELLERKFITEIKTTDNRSNYYSITPLGIVYYIHNSSFLKNIGKIKSSFLKKIFFILESFSNKYIPPYRSEIFIPEKWNFKDFYNSSLRKSIGDVWIRSRSLRVFSDFNITNPNYIEFNFKLMFERPIGFNLARFEFGKEFVHLGELSKGMVRGDKYKPIKLTDEQFHNYLSKLIMCSIVYDYFLIEQILEKKTKTPIDWSKYPDNIQVILQVFNFLVGNLFQENENNITSILQGLK
jgi:hypothetical protein